MFLNVGLISFNAAYCLEHEIVLRYQEPKLNEFLAKGRHFMKLNLIKNLDKYIQANYSR